MFHCVLVRYWFDAQQQHLHIVCDVGEHGVGMAEELDEPVFLSWEEYWAIAVRRRWWILLPLFLVWAAVWGVSWFLPSTYQSESLILVEQQKVPDQYVVPNVTSNLQERCRA